MLVVSRCPRNDKQFGQNIIESFAPMSAFLPHFDPDPATRSTGLDTKRTEYQYNHAYVSPLAFVERVPLRDRFHQEWTAMVIAKVMTNMANQADADSAIRRKLRQYENPLTNLVLGTSTAIRTLVRAVGSWLGMMRASRRLLTIEDYNSMFHLIGLPPIAKDYHQDSVFAEMRLAGPNPVMLHRIDKPDDRFPVTDHHFQIALPGDSLAAAGAENRLFLVDYHFLDGIELGKTRDGLQKYVYAPLALFAAHKHTKALTPVAIQCKQAPGPDNPIFTPDDGFNWLIAKTIVETADGNYHEAITHLGRTHLFVEPFVVATHRQLAPNHPLNVLLRPHFEGTLSINHMARTKLICDGGIVDRLLGGTINATRGLTAKGLQNHMFTDAVIPNSFARRGVADTSILPNYPFRDDGMLYWDAIREWVASYLRCFYRSDAEVSADVEVTAWLAEVAALEGGRLPGVPAGGSLAELVDAVSLVIFTASVQHAAVNFPQYDIMSYTPAMPLAGYAPAPTRKKGATEQDYLANLPPRDMACLQMSTGYMLGDVHYSRLGHYGDGYFGEPRLDRLAAKFAAKLDDIGKTIAERNQHRRPYPFLVPSGVPQSINI